MALQPAAAHGQGAQAGAPPLGDPGTAAQNGIIACRHCGLAKPRPKPLKLIQESWHGLECPYCFGHRRYQQGDVKVASLTRRAKVERLA